MFARITSALFALTFVAAVVASPGGGDNEYEQCNGGTVQCCNSTQDSKSLDAQWTKWLGLVGVDVEQLTGQVGFTCSGVNAIGVGGGSSCNQQKVCCSNNNFNGVVALGCTPINVAL